MSALTFETLSAELTQALAARSTTPPKTVARCTLGRDKVMVLIEYPLDSAKAEPSAHQTLDWLEQHLRNQFDTSGLPDEAADLSEYAEEVPVQLYLKHLSEDKPFTMRSFTWKVADGFDALFGPTDAALDPATRSDQALDLEQMLDVDPHPASAQVLEVNPDSAESEDADDIFAPLAVAPDSVVMLPDGEEERVLLELEEDLLTLELDADTDESFEAELNPMPDLDLGLDLDDHAQPGVALGHSVNSGDALDADLSIGITPSEVSAYSSSDFSLPGEAPTLESAELDLPTVELPIVIPPVGSGDSQDFFDLGGGESSSASALDAEADLAEADLAEAELAEENLAEEQETPASAEANTAEQTPDAAAEATPTDSAAIAQAETASEAVALEETTVEERAVDEPLAEEALTEEALTEEPLPEESPSEASLSDETWVVDEPPSDELLSDELLSDELLPEESDTLESSDTLDSKDWVPNDLDNLSLDVSQMETIETDSANQVDELTSDDDVAETSEDEANIETGEEVEAIEEDFFQVDGVAFSDAEADYTAADYTATDDLETDDTTSDLNETNHQSDVDDNSIAYEYEDTEVVYDGNEENSSYYLEGEEEELADYEDVALIDEQEVQRQREQWQQQSKGNPLVVVGAFGFLLACVLGFVFTRPCTIGSCSRIQTAQEQGDDAIASLQTDSSQSAVTEAKKQLQHSIQMLEPIPAWSSHYDEAQAVLPGYERQLFALDQISEAQDKAWSAASKSQDPPHSVSTWEDIADEWRAAASALSDVPLDSPVRDLAERKLVEYRANLSTILVRIETESGAEVSLRQAQSAASQATQQSEQADSLEAWEIVLSNWDTAVTSLRQIPQGTHAYGEAQQLLPEYEDALQEVRTQVEQERSASRILSRAQQLATNARSAETEEQWNLSVEDWNRAIIQLRDVPAGSLAHTQAQTQLATYTSALSVAENNMQVSLRFQSVEPNFYWLCGGSDVHKCTYSLEAGKVRLDLAQGYDTVINESITPPPQRSGINSDAQLVTRGNQLLQQLTLMSTQAQIPIELYDADGDFLARYRPDLDGFVRQ